MVAKFKFITGAIIFRGDASKVAIYNWTSIYSAFSAYLWGFMMLAGSYGKASIKDACASRRDHLAWISQLVATQTFARNGSSHFQPAGAGDRVKPGNVVNRRPLTQCDVGPSWMKNRATLIQ
jgi:hypothetical protein